jgi:hypothetical protein
LTRPCLLPSLPPVRRDGKRKESALNYEKPKVEDYGSLEEMTAAQCLGGDEDAGNKQFHSTAPCRSDVRLKRAVRPL